MLDAILDAGIEPAVVIADRPCVALDNAAAAGLPTELVERTSFKPDFDRDAYTSQVVDVLEAPRRRAGGDAGFGTITSNELYEAYEGRVLNTHPALLPGVPGLARRRGRARPPA